MTVIGNRILSLALLTTAALLLVHNPSAQAADVIAKKAPAAGLQSADGATKRESISGHLHTSATPSIRVVTRVDDAKRVMLYGHVPSILRHAQDKGRLSTSTPAQHLVMVLKASDEQKSELHKVLDEQQDKNSANYHQWTTPEEFGEKFGVHDADIAKVSAWLKSQGFTVDDVSKSKRVLHFSGTTGQLEQAFKTEMHNYVLNGEKHVSNNSEISVPTALSPVIGSVTMHNFFRKGRMGPVHKLRDAKLGGDYGTSSSSTHYLGPWDFATIYNTFPMLNSGIDGTGSSIAVVGRSDILLSDVQSYRSLFDLPANDPIFIHAGQDNGTQPGDDGESDLDVEISGGIAPNAQVYFVIGTPTFLVDGITNSIEYIVENNTADIMSISYGSCESVEGVGGNEFNNQAFEQAAAQGISVFVAAGDNGPAECDNQNDSWEVYGYATGGEASTPYSVSVGGSQGFEANTYWATSTELTPPYWGLSALSYIPEVPWNESKAADTSKDTSGLAGLWSGSGGISSYYIQPSWQRGSGVYTTDPAYTQGGNWVTSINLTNGGSGYTATPTVTVTGGGCTVEPTAIATLTGGAVSSVAFQYFTSAGTEKTGQGYGCTSVPTVAFTAAPAGGTTAIATAAIGPMVNTPPLVTGVPHRYTPDLVLNAASGHDATLFCSEGSCQWTTSGSTTTLVDAGLVGGTSVAAPSMAGIQALINQANGGRQGMPGYIYYALSAAQTEANCNSITPPASGAGCAFQDITTGDNYICAGNTCTTTAQKMGWPATTGYDLASGLGSVNAANLSSQWKNVVFNSSNTTLGLSQSSGIAQGSSITLSGTVAAGSGSSVPTGDVAFILSNGNIGSTVDISGDANDGAFVGTKAFATLSGGSYSATLTNLPGGSYTITARYGGDTTFASSLSTPVPVSVSQGATAITITPQTLNLLTCVSTNASAYTYGSPAYIPINVAATSGSGVPTGTLTITVDGATWGTVPLDPNGNGYLIAGNYGTSANSCLYGYIYSQGPLLQGGTHSIGASYSGDSTFPAANATPVNVTVSQISSIPTLAAVGTTMAITPGFNVPLVATFTVPALTSGAATAASGPTGTVTFTDTTTGTTLGTAAVVPNVVYSVSATSTTAYPSYTFGATAAGATTGITTIGANAVTASYSGDANYAATVSTAVTVTVDSTTPVATTTTITSSANPTTIAGRPTFTATIGAASGTAPTSGTVAFYDGTALLGTGTVGTAHTATFRPGTTPAFVGGTHSITGVYGGIAADGPSTSPVFTETVIKAAGTIALQGKTTGAAGQSYTLSAVLTPAVSNAVYPPVLSGVQFFDGTTNIGSATALTINEAQGGYGIWNATLATTSLASGTHTITAQYTDTNFAFTASNALTVKVYGSPVGNLEEAVDSTTGSTTVSNTDTLFVGGWAADPTDGSPLTSVKILIDGAVVGTPTLGGSRPDVASYYNNPAYANSGFTFTYPAGSLTVGSHVVSAVATNGGKVSTTLGSITINVTVVYAAPVGNLEQAADATTGSSTVPTSDSIFVSGWIADPTDGSPLTNVKVYVDGTLTGTPTLNISRPDVASYYNNPAYANSGFNFTYAVRSLTAGSHAVTVVGINSHSVSTTLNPINITVTNTPPVGNLETAVDNATGSSTISQSSGDLLYVGGWAADYHDNGAAQKVQILIDGVALGTATLGGSRPDVASYYNQPGWSTSGYSFAVSASSLSVGSHSITAVATDSLGLMTTLGPQSITVIP